MTNCNTEYSSRFLAGELSPIEESGFVDHLEACPHCQRQLEEDAGCPQAWESARELLAYSFDHDPRVGCGALGNDVLSSNVVNGPKLFDRSTLAFLAPTDDPTMIGRVGPYEISGLLGRGATGIVLKGFDRALGRNVAIKVLDPAISGSGVARQRFAREARAMAAISHEHVVPVFRVDEHGNLPYFVMEYVAGGSLERRLRTEGTLDALSVVRIGLQTAQALVVAHGQGLVHRDIKPANILLDQGTERVRVADFGLARITNDVSCTRSGFLAGTPQYMAPEQVRSETCDAQSDLFSLGCVMYALCTGHTPFRADTVYAVMQRIVHDTPRSIRAQNPQIPVWLEAFILRLLAKEKIARFGSANDVVNSLTPELAWLQNPQGPAPARDWCTQPRSLISRIGRRFIAASVTVLLSTVIGIAVWLLVVPGAENGSDKESGQGQFDSDGSGYAAPLWNADGTDRVQASLDALEHRWRANSLATEIDSWQEETARLRGRLAELSAELQTSEQVSPHNP